MIDPAKARERVNVLTSRPVGMFVEAERVARRSSSERFPCRATTWLLGCAVDPEHKAGWFGD